MADSAAGGPSAAATGSKRQRATMSCDACSKRRTKCDNKSPKCTRCQTKGLECLYTRKMKKRGPTKGSATSVKERIARLEKLLEGGEGVDAATRRAVAQGLKELGSAEDGDYDDEEDEMFGSQSSEAGRGERAMVPAIDAGPLDAYSFGETGNFGMPEVTPELGTPGSWQLGSSSLAPAEPNYAPPPGLHSTPQPIYAPPPQLPTLPPLLGPPTGLGLPLFMDPTLYKSIVNTYIKIIWPTIPILHPPSLLENPSVYSEALLLLVLAMGIRFSHDPAVARYIASSGHADPRSCAEAMYTRAHAAAKLFLDDPGHAPNELDLFTTIHLTLFVGPMSGSLSAGLRWTEMNMVLLREIVLDDNADLSTQRGIRSEEKRRLFWFLFCFDRAYAFGSPSRNFAILQERALSTRLPVSDAVFSGEEPVANSWSLPSATLSLFATDLSTFPLFVPTLGFFAKLVLLFYIFSQIVELQRLPPAFQTEEAQMMIQLQLDAFYECLPMQDRTETLLAEPLPAASTDKPPMALFLLIPYYTIKTVLYSPPGSANPDNDEWLGSKAFLKSAEAAEMATRCVAAMFPGHIEMVPFWNFVPLMRITQMHLFLIKKLAGMEADEIRREIHQRVELHISMFQAMGNRMPLAPRIAQLLTMLLEKYDAIAAGKPVNRAQLTFFSERLKEVFGFASWEEAIEVLSQRLGTQSYHVDMVRFISDALTS